jgi:predicted nuclease of predicted toxin-antitoxin system
MRLCANENIPGDGVAALRRQGHDVLWVREAMPGATDEQVIERAIAEQRLLLTFDKDFGELAFRHGRKAAAGVVLFRINQPSAAAVAETIARVLASRDD